MFCFFLFLTLLGFKYAYRQLLFFSPPFLFVQEQLMIQLIRVLIKVCLLVIKIENMVGGFR